MNSFQWWKRQSYAWPKWKHNDNIENYSSDGCDSEESSEEDESSGNDESLENKTLGNHMASQSDISKDHHLHDQGQYECLYTWLYFNNDLRGYMCKICEMYYCSKPCPSGENWDAWSHKGIKFKKTLAKEFFVMRSLRIIKLLL